MQTSLLKRGWCYVQTCVQCKGDRSCVDVPLGLWSPWGYDILTTDCAGCCVYPSLAYLGILSYDCSGYASVLQLEESKERLRWACQAEQPFCCRDKSLTTCEPLWRVPKLVSIVQAPKKSSQSAQGEEGKRTSWIERVTILGFIYSTYRHESLTELSLNVWISMNDYAMTCSK